MLTLGWQTLDWLLENLAAPDRREYEPLVLTDEQADFILRLYEVDPTGRRRLRRRAVLSTPKGWGSSPMLAMLSSLEALGPVVPDGLDASGQPVGRPWDSLRRVRVQLAAVAEGQTSNSWERLLDMLRLGPVVDNYPGLEPLNSFVNLPFGKIEYVTSAAASHEGDPIVFAGLDQTEAWTAGNGGQRFAAVIRRNVGKNDGTTVEAPNAYRPGDGSVAEMSAEAAKLDPSILYVHRQAPKVDDLQDRKAVHRALVKVYGASARDRGGWVNLDRLVEEIADPATDEGDARQYYLNEPVVPDRAAFDPRDWQQMAGPLLVVADAETITLGFDGAQYDDATALIATRLSDGHQWPLLIAEKPDGEAGVGWQVSEDAVDAAVDGAFERFRVVLMFADPWGDWRPKVGEWAARHGSMVQEFDTRHTVKMARSVELYRTDVRRHAFTHDGDSTMRRHIENARTAERQGLKVLVKEHRRSPRKIDAAVAGCLSYAARDEALRQGLTAAPARPKVGFVAY